MPQAFYPGGTRGIIMLEEVERMEYFISHIGYVLICGLFVAALGIFASIAAKKSQEENEKHGYDPAWDKSEFACAGCKMVGTCMGMAKLKPENFDSVKDAVDGCGHYEPKPDAADAEPERG